MESQSITALARDDTSLHLLFDRSVNFQDDVDVDTLMSDARYAEELILQEVLMASVINAKASHTRNDDVSLPGNSPSPVSATESPPHKASHTQNDDVSLPGNSPSPVSATESPTHNCSTEIGESSQFLCEICAEHKDGDQMFTVQRCSHRFCNDCIAKHISVKIHKSPNISNQENGQWFACPGLDCGGVIEIERCLAIVPREVSTMWGDIMCESMIAAAQKFYCPYKDCSALLVNDDEEMMIRESECPFCHRLFCAQCQVPWHCGVDCEEFWSLSLTERGRDDLMVHELAKLQKWQRCPHCMFFVEKNDGCVHMTCRCGYEFCYTCGATWKSSHHESCQGDS